MATPVVTDMVLSGSPHAGEPLALHFRLVDPETGMPVSGVHDARVLSFAIPRHRRHAQRGDAARRRRLSGRGHRAGGRQLLRLRRGAVGGAAAGGGMGSVARPRAVRMDSKMEENIMAQIDTSKIAYCQIYPGVGIARLGNSPDEFFVGPETPGETASPVGGFKDKAGRIKRQAARFRLYAFDQANVCLGEVTAADGADITWTVHLANAKPSFNTFLGRFWQSQYPNFYKYNPNETPLRNQEIMDPEQRKRLLIIDPGPRSIKPGERRWSSIPAPSGRLPYSDIPSDRRPAADRLAGTRDGWWNCPTKDRAADAGGDCPPRRPCRSAPCGSTSAAGCWCSAATAHGHTLIPDNPIGRLMGQQLLRQQRLLVRRYLRRTGVRARCRIGGKAVEVRDRGMGVGGAAQIRTRLRVHHHALRHRDGNLGEEGERRRAAARGRCRSPRDIYPILTRLDGFQWLNRTVYQHHGANTNFDFGEVNGPLFKLLHYKASRKEQERRHAMTSSGGCARRAWWRPPRTPTTRRKAPRWANYRYMPQMSGDGGQVSTSEDGPASVMDPVFDCATKEYWYPTGSAVRRRAVRRNRHPAHCRPSRAAIMSLG